MFSKIVPRGGGTYICPGGIPAVAKYLAAHPEGLAPIPTPGHELFDYMARLNEGGNDFVEIIGEPGDVVLLHPLMLHSASKNNLRIPRVITNPPVGSWFAFPKLNPGADPALLKVALKEPFNFNRENPDEFSLVELKTLRALGKDRFDFKPSIARKSIVPPRVGNQDKMKQAELQRLKDHAIKNNLPIPDICV